jgi:hypothetical protein
MVCHCGFEALDEKEKRNGGRCGLNWVGNGCRAAVFGTREGNWKWERWERERKQVGKGRLYIKRQEGVLDARGLREKEGVENPDLGGQG